MSPGDRGNPPGVGLSEQERARVERISEELAEALAHQGAKVQLVKGPTNLSSKHSGVEEIPVKPFPLPRQNALFPRAALLIIVPRTGCLHQAPLQEPLPWLE